MSDIGKKLMNRRKSLGLTLQDVGDAVGVGKSTVRKWENGMIKNMGRDKIESLAKVLGMDPMEFFRDDVKPVKPPMVKLKVPASIKQATVEEARFITRTTLSDKMPIAKEAKAIVADPQFKSMMKLWEVSSKDAKDAAIRVLKVANKPEKGR